MKEGQEEIYTITATAWRPSARARSSSWHGPRVSRCCTSRTRSTSLAARGRQLPGDTLKSLTKSDVDLSGIKGGDAGDAGEEKKPEDQARLDKRSPGSSCAGRASGGCPRLEAAEESAVCLVAPDKGMDLRQERLLKHHESFAGHSKPILEINPGHELTGTSKPWRTRTGWTPEPRRPIWTNWRFCFWIRRVSSRASRFPIPAPSRGG